MAGDIGDHTTNIAETVVWMVSGERMPIERPKTKIAGLSQTIASG